MALVTSAAETVPMPTPARPPISPIRAPKPDRPTTTPVRHPSPWKPTATVVPEVLVFEEPKTWEEGAGGCGCLQEDLWLSCPDSETGHHDITLCPKKSM